MSYSLDLLYVEPSPGGAKQELHWGLFMAVNDVTLAGSKSLSLTQQQVVFLHAPRSHSTIGPRARRARDVRLVASALVGFRAPPSSLSRTRHPQDFSCYKPILLTIRPTLIRPTLSSKHPCHLAALDLPHLFLELGLRSLWDCSSLHSCTLA